MGRKSIFAFLPNSFSIEAIISIIGRFVGVAIPSVQVFFPQVFVGVQLGLVPSSWAVVGVGVGGVFVGVGQSFSVGAGHIGAERPARSTVGIVDDDLVVPAGSITALKSFFDQAPLTLHGIFGRRISPDYEYSYSGYERGETPIVLTRCLMMHRSYADVFLEAEASAAELITRGSPKWNGEDIFLSLLSIRDSGTLPRAYDLPFKNVWRMHRGSISRTDVPPDDPERMDHKSYRSWFTREAVRLLGIQAEIDDYLSNAT